VREVQLTAADESATHGLVRAVRTLVALALAVSVVHYLDNTVNYADFPEPTSGPAPSRALVGASWFLFAAAAVAAWRALDRRRFTAAAVLLALFSVSGLVGLGHYTVPGATDMPWWRQAHVVVDIACGVALLAAAVAVARAGRRTAGARDAVTRATGPTSRRPPAPRRRG
jgi:hypothetical protein